MSEYVLRIHSIDNPYLELGALKRVIREGEVDTKVIERLVLRECA